MFLIKKLKRDKKSIQSEFRRNGFVDFKGELEILGHNSKGKLVHYDKGENTVTVWAKHATMHLLSGEGYTSWGSNSHPFSQRSFDETTDHTATGTGEGTNSEGTLISGQQFFSNNSSPDFNLDSRWTKSSINAQTVDGDRSDDDAEMKYPFFPTKMLFGTGFEWDLWTNIPTDYTSVYSGQGWDQTTFDTNIGNVLNVYSNIWGGSNLTQARSMNDIYAAALTTPTIQDTDFAIPGAIKNGTYMDSATERFGSAGGTIKTFYEGGNEYLAREWQGVGDPCFIYSRRESRFFQSGGEVQLTNDTYLENKITYTVVMPEQTGALAGIYYPYNGYTLKVAGLYCDAKLLLGNSEPTGGGGDEHVDEQDNWNKQKYGIMFAKRFIAPITKSHDVSITARWSIYL